MSINRNIAPQIHDAVAFDFVLPSINSTILDNGVPLHWLNAGVQDVVEINWIFDAGVWYEPHNAVAQATAAQLKSGTLHKTSKQINEALEFYGANLKVGAGNDHATITLHALTKHLPAILPIVLEIMVQPVFPEEELVLYQQNTIQRLLVSLRECDFVANQQIDSTLFGVEHPYGRFTQKERIEALKVGDLISFHQQFYQASSLKIFMAGKVSAQEVDLLNQLFGTIPNSKFLVSAPAHQYNLLSDYSPQRINNDPNGVQGAIRIGRKFVTRQHPDFASLVVLNTLFGGYFGSRLMSNVREDKGYTYGIYSSIGAFAQDASLIIHTEVGKDVIENAVKEIYSEMDRLCNDKVQEEELLLVKNYLLGNILGDLDGPFSILQRWRSLILNGFDVHKFDENIQTYKGIDAAKLQDLAQQYLNKNDFIELVVV